jgi:hypothetical protein
VGAIVDLPHLSVMVMGLDDWPTEASLEVHEDRLLAAVKKELGSQVASLRTPPVEPDSTDMTSNPFDGEAAIGVPVAPFPRWVICPRCRLLAPLNSDLFQLKIDPFRKDRTRYIHTACNYGTGRSPAVVPARFLVACAHGHLDDFPWVEFVHRGPTDCRYSLRLYELGASGEAADVEIKCVVCGKTRRIAEAFEQGKAHMPACRGRWPHQRTFAEEGCQVKNVTPILLGASNSWFPVTLSALSMPTTTDQLAQRVDAHWGMLQNAANLQNVGLLRQIGQLQSFAQYTDEQIWEMLQRKRDGLLEATHEHTDLKGPEWEVFSCPDPSRNNDHLQLREVDPPSAYTTYFDKVVLVERLREVRALTGFTRIESPGDYNDLGELPEEKRAPLSRTAPVWVPTCQVRGEGIFIQFCEPLIESWVQRLADLDQEFREAHRQWRTIRKLEPDAGYPTLRYVLLHSLAHALIRQLSLECGYTTASIRERIYSRPPGGDQQPMAGLLIYTAAPDSEGTLGGLVSLGEPQSLERHLDQALEAIRLCASDPLCAEHHPYRDGLTLHGAACHACLHAPETSCERGNKYLDRSVLVPTVEQKHVAFFEV